VRGKTARGIIRRKIEEWISSIDDLGVRQTAEKNTIVTGGCIASMLLNERVNDFDLYFRTHKAAMDVAAYYIKKFNDGLPESTQLVKLEDLEGRIRIKVRSAGIATEEGDAGYQYFETIPDPDAADASEYVDAALKVIEEGEDDEEKPKYRPIFLSSNAITLSQHVQLVVRFYGEPDKIHENYDFAHCMNYWTSWDDELVLRQPALESLLARDLHYVGSKYPLCSIIRTRKFIKRGWTISAGQYLKMAMQLNELDLSDVSVLEEQLVGVDVAYFTEIIEKLKGRGMEKVDSTYLLEVIDRIF